MPAMNRQTWHSWDTGLIPVKMHLLKFNNRNTKKSCEICSKLTIKTTERRQ